MIRKRLLQDYKELCKLELICRAEAEKGSQLERSALLSVAEDCCAAARAMETQLRDEKAG